jgi:hypothetical protein
MFDLAGLPLIHTLLYPAKPVPMNARVEPATGASLSPVLKLLQVRTYLPMTVLHDALKNHHDRKSCALGIGETASTAVINRTSLAVQCQNTIKQVFEDCGVQLILRTVMARVLGGELRLRPIYATVAYCSLVQSGMQAFNGQTKNIFQLTA